MFEEDGRSITVLPEGKDEKRFTFDQVFPPDTTQKVIGKVEFIMDREYSKE